MRRVWVLIVALGIVSAACADGGGASAEISPEVEAYLDAVHEIDADYDAAIGDIFGALTRTYPTREAIFVAVSDAGLAGAARNTRTRAESLTPPDQYREDHQLWIEFRGSVVDKLDDLDAALDGRDLQKLMEVMTYVEQRRGTLLLVLGHDVCLAVVDDDPLLCGPQEDLPGGDYGDSVYEITRLEILSTLGLFDFPADMSPEERVIRLGQVQPGIEASLKAAGDALATVEPPSEFEKDHQALVRFYRVQHETAVAITRAAAVGDTGTILALFSDSQAISDETVSVFSQDFKLIAAPFLWVSG